MSNFIGQSLFINQVSGTNTITERAMASSYSQLKCVQMNSINSRPAEIYKIKT